MKESYNERKKRLEKSEDNTDTLIAGTIVAANNVGDSNRDTDYSNNSNNDNSSSGGSSCSGGGSD